MFLGFWEKCISTLAANLQLFNIKSPPRNSGQAKGCPLLLHRNHRTHSLASPTLTLQFRLPMCHRGRVSIAGPVFSLQLLAQAG